jgi:plastocyanin
MFNKIHSLIFFMASFFGLAFSIQAIATEYTALQQNKTFVPEKLKVKVGDSVNFLNDDAFYHNVFSLSDVKSFDLGSYPKGKSRKVIFDKPGIVEVECSIHPNMHMIIEVKK